MVWLARENLHDSSTARAQFAAAIPDSEMGIKSAVPAPGSEPSGETPKKQAPADVQCNIRKRDRWVRSTTATIIGVAVAAFAGFFAGYSSRAPNLSDITLARSPEIRRAIPVEPEIRRAIPVQPEIRRAIPVQTREHSARRRGPANPHVGKTADSSFGESVQMMRSGNARHLRREL